MLGIITGKDYIPDIKNDKIPFADRFWLNKNVKGVIVALVGSESNTLFLFTKGRSATRDLKVQKEYVEIGSSAKMEQILMQFSKTTKLAIVSTGFTSSIEESPIHCDSQDDVTIRATDNPMQFSEYRDASMMMQNIYTPNMTLNVTSEASSNRAFLNYFREVNTIRHGLLLADMITAMVSDKFLDGCYHFYAHESRITLFFEKGAVKDYDFFMYEDHGELTDDQRKDLKERGEYDSLCTDLLNLQQDRGIKEMTFCHLFEGEHLKNLEKTLDIHRVKGVELVNISEKTARVNFL
jgi:hypothetical protein